MRMLTDAIILLLQLFILEWMLLYHMTKMCLRCTSSVHQQPLHYNSPALAIGAESIGFYFGLLYFEQITVTCICEGIMTSGSFADKYFVSLCKC
jgi:hypothetical protein